MSSSDPNGAGQVSDALIDLQARAARLSLADRARLAAAIIESLEPADGGDIEEAWRIEAEERLRRIERGESRWIPGEEVFARVRRRPR